MIPNVIKNKIVGEANWRSTNGHGGVDDITRDNFILAAEYGYSLASQPAQPSAEEAAKEYADRFYQIKPYDNYESDYDYRTQCAKNLQVQEHFMAGQASKHRGDEPTIDSIRVQAFKDRRDLKASKSINEQLAVYIEAKEKEILRLKGIINEIKELKGNATTTQELFPLLQYISKLNPHEK